MSGALDDPVLAHGTPVAEPSAVIVVRQELPGTSSSPRRIHVEETRTRATVPC